MPAYTATPDNAQPFGTFYKGASAHLPVTFAQFIQASFALGGNNDVDSILEDLNTRIEAALDQDDLINILGNIDNVVDYQDYTGQWRAGAYTAGQVAKASNGEYYRRLTDGTDGAGDEPTTTSATWEQLETLAKATAVFHEYLTTLAGGGSDADDTGGSVHIWARHAHGVSGERLVGGIAFDSNDVLYLVGGSTDDIWSYDGTNWTKFADVPATETSPRGIAFDSNDVLYLVGSSTDDIWSYDGTNWTKFADVPATETIPQSIAFDSNDVLYLVGYISRDVWSYDGTNWTKFADTPTRETENIGIAFDSNDVLYLVGAHLEGVWSYDGTNWTWYTDGPPQERSPLAIAFDSNDLLHLTGTFSNDIFAYHELSTGSARTKIFEQDWGSLPVGTNFRVGDQVKRFLQWFVCEVAHSKGGTGPDNDPTNWSPLTNYAGVYDTAKWYHAGIYTEYRGRLAFSREDITPNDPVPDHPTNTKWYFPQNDINGIWRPWRYVEPSGGLDDLEIDSTDAASGQVETVTPDIDEDRILVHSIRAAESAGIKTQMHINGKIKYFLKQDAPLSNSSGAILTVGLWVGADPRTGQGRFLHELDRNTLTLADFRNSNGGRDAYGTTADVEKNFSLLVNETDFATWNLAQHEELVFILYGNNINGAASVKAELSDVVISYDRSTDNIDHLREEIEDQLRALVQHQEIIVDELPDPAGAAAPDYAYLSRIWRPTQGFTGNQGVVEYSPGEYQRTTGTANRAKFLFSNGSYSDGNNLRDIIGFIQRGNRLRVGSSHFLENVGEAIHNPVGGAVAGIFFTHDPSNVLAGGSASWVLWVKRSLASRKPPWNVPTNIEQGGFKVRLYHDSTSFDIKFAHGGSFEVIDGIEYEYYYAPTTTGLSWINNLDLNDVAASTIEIDFRRESDNQLFWLGDEAEGWTWRDPDENPTSISRIDKIERGSLVQGIELASLTGPSSPGQLTNRAWTIPAGTSGISQSNNNQHPTGNWTRYLYIDPDVYCHSLAGSHGLLIVVERGGSIVSSSYLPFTTAHAQWVAADEIFVGKWKTGASNANTLNAGWGVDSGRLHLVLSCSGADNQSTVKIYRTN